MLLLRKAVSLLKYPHDFLWLGYGITFLLEKNTNQLLNFLKWLSVKWLMDLVSKVCFQFNSVQSLSRVWLFATAWTAAHQASLSITISWSLPKLMSIESVLSSKHLILCRHLLLLPSMFPSIRVFSNESALRMRWPKYWSFSFSLSPSNEHPGLISFRRGWLDHTYHLHTKSFLDPSTVFRTTYAVIYNPVSVQICRAKTFILEQS